MSALTYTRNVVRYSEGSAMACAYCSYDTVTNNHVEHAGYPFARSIEFHGIQTHYVTVARNRLHYDGAGGIARLWGEGNRAYLNHITKSGQLIVDNEGIQGGMPTTNASFNFNWVHDSRGLGLRFDAGENGEFGLRNNLLFNVVFRNMQGGLSGKANEAFNYRNTGIDNQAGVDFEADDYAGFGGGHTADLKICQCYPGTCLTELDIDPELPAFTNNNSFTWNNVGIMDPGTAGGLLNPYDIPANHTHNINLALVTWGTTPARERRALFRDYDNYVLLRATPTRPHLRTEPTLRRSCTSPQHVICSARGAHTSPYVSGPSPARPHAQDFRPNPDGPLVDAGKVNTVQPYIPGAPAVLGAAPDIGGARLPRSSTARLRLRHQGRLPAPEFSR